MKQCPRCGYAPPKATITPRNAMPAADVFERFMAICEALNVRPDQIRGEGRSALQAEKRWIVIYTMHKADIHAADIAWCVNRTRTTIRHSLLAVNKRLKTSDADGWYRLIAIAEGHAGYTNGAGRAA